MARILLVEDEKDARRMIALGLERLGHAVDICDNGVQAIGALRLDTQVVVTDLVMPMLDGIGLLKALTDREHPAAKVVITSFADKQRTVEALNLGADYLLEKPFSVAQLEFVIQKLLSREGTKGTASELCQRQLAGLPITDRERQLITLVLKGLSNAEMADTLSTTEQAVKSSLFALYRKLDIASRGELFHLIFPV